jgi:mannose/fructose/N-acetylgalactosamine-specific phosphotransferase system component IIC
MKEQIKKHLISKLKIGGFILALAGWVMLITVPLEMAGRDLSGLESFVETPAFSWGLKIFIIILLVFLIKGQSIVDDFIEKYKWLDTALKIIFWGGVAGWIIGLVRKYL